MRRTDEMCHTFVEEQICPWLRRTVCHDEMYIWAVDRARCSPSFYMFNVKNDRADFFEKSNVASDDPYRHRAIEFSKLFCAAFATRPLDREFIICVDVGDEAVDNTRFPVFTFQKNKSYANLLIPDVEMITSDYFANIDPDNIPFSQKECHATFAGSTTGGGLIDADVLAANAMPRLRAARFFKSHPNVHFRLSALAQCASSDIENALLEEGFGGDLISWSDAYRSKFGISIDGNGAACSRPAILLRSRCTMLKYHSENVLYYFSQLSEGEHFIEIREDSDVDRIVSAEKKEPGLYAKIADESRRFAETVLHKRAILTYMAELMHAYRHNFHSLSVF